MVETILGTGQYRCLSARPLPRLHADTAQGETEEAIDLLKEGMKKGAQNAYLQVVEGNDTARALYKSLGFHQLYTYWFRVQPDKNGNFPPEK